MVGPARQWVGGETDERPLPAEEKQLLEPSGILGVDSERAEVTKQGNLEGALAIGDKGDLEKLASAGPLSSTPNLGSLCTIVPVRGIPG